MRNGRLPEWFTVPLGMGEKYRNVRGTLHGLNLNTVCSSARCPNLGECWNSGTATFMILGDTCSRNCRFCAVHHGTPASVDPDEPARIAEAVRRLDLKYVVITSVTRDDLVDGGAGHFATTTRLLKTQSPHIRIELLIPDFKGDSHALSLVLESNPDVLNHNIETVPRLYSLARPQADYSRSLELLRAASQHMGRMQTKSGMMLGMGETRPEILSVIRDLYDAGVGRLTLGQYLQPDEHGIPVHRYLHPDEFLELADIAKTIGFAFVASGPRVRSSYHAGESTGAVN